MVWRVFPLLAAPGACKIKSSFIYTGGLKFIEANPNNVITFKILYTVI